MLVSTRTHTSQEWTVPRPRQPAVTLPAHVHCVKVKGKPYYYYHPHRGTGRDAGRVRLPDDPSLPEWWEAYRALSGSPAPAKRANSVSSLIKAWKDSPQWREIGDKTRGEWERYLQRIEDAWGELEVRGIEPRHVLALQARWASTPAAANNMMRCLSSMLSWSVPRGWR